MNLRGREFGAMPEMSDVASVRSASGGSSRSYVVTADVRRLMPSECARIFGFPPDHCAIQFRGKPASDGPMYRAYGNSMAVPCLRWILERVEQQAACVSAAA
jgi:DNA (cytosine-5)-methyltransferase 1